MTAIGFTLAWVGLFLGRISYQAYEPEQSAFFHLSAFIAFVGVVLFMIGIAVWLWGVMP